MQVLSHSEQTADSRVRRSSRRRFLTTCVGLGAGLLARPSAATGSAWLVGAQDRADGRHGLAWRHADGTLGRVDLPFRGHGLTALGPDLVMLFARRPGDQAALVNLRHGRVESIISAGPNRHFYGHGAFSPDGRLLYTTENDYAAERGVIGVRDGVSLAKLGELPAFGIGPHDLQPLRGGRVLLVAVGGIQTHPDKGREKLNLDEMRPALVYIDTYTGKLLLRHELPHRQLSTRHLSIAGDQFAVACQWEGQGASPPLLALGKLGDQPTLLAEDAAQRAMRGYAASIRIDPLTQRVAMTSPRGGVLGLWSMKSRELQASLRLPDVCGLAHAAPGRFVASSGNGRLYTINAADSRVEPLSVGSAAHSYWDNHLLTISA